MVYIEIRNIKSFFKRLLSEIVLKLMPADYEELFLCTDQTYSRINFSERPVFCFICILIAVFLHHCPINIQEQPNFVVHDKHVRMSKNYYKLY